MSVLFYWFEYCSQILGLPCGGACSRCTGAALTFSCLEVESVEAGDPIDVEKPANCVEKGNLGKSWKFIEIKNQINFLSKLAWNAVESILDCMGEIMEIRLQIFLGEP